MSKTIREIKGKSIKNAEIEARESADGCWYATLVLDFTDGSEYSFRIHAQPQVFGQYFKSDRDEDAMEEKALITP